MKLCLSTTSIIFMVMLLVACGSSPTLDNPSGEPVAVAVDDSVSADDIVPDIPGLGPIVYRGQEPVQCTKKTRTGTRIPREVCRADAFNGLFPGGIDMGAEGEAQPGYGSK